MTKYRRSTFHQSFAEQKPVASGKNPEMFLGIRNLWWKSLLGVFVILGAGLYFVQLNRVSQEGFQIQDLEQRIQRLQLDNQELAQKTSQLRSLDRVQTLASKQGLTLSQNVVYLSGSEDIVALSSVPSQE